MNRGYSFHRGTSNPHSTVILTLATMYAKAVASGDESLAEYLKVRWEMYREKEAAFENARGRMFSECQAAIVAVRGRTS